MKNKFISILCCSLVFSSIVGCTKEEPVQEEKIEEKAEEQPKQEEPKEEIVEEEEKEEKVYDRQDRIDAYQKEHPKLDQEECIKRVYMNLDKEPYSETAQVQDLNSYVMLVNKYNGLPSNYVPSDLANIDGGCQVRSKVAQAFKELQQACLQFGLSVTGWSAFRSYDYQYSLYHNGVANYGLEYAEKYWTHPGFSEHQTGLTIDVCLDGNKSDLDAARYNKNYDKFKETLHSYGFIVRYGDDKQEYTQIAPESWHIRYVGKELATYLYENNLSLDEFYGLVDAGLLEWDGLEIKSEPSSSEEDHLLENGDYLFD